MAATFQNIIPIITLACIFAVGTLPACSNQNSDNYAKVQEDGTVEYDTSAAVDPMNYTMYANKEITMITNILSSHIANGDNVVKGKYLASDELRTLEGNLDMVQEAIDSVDTMHPPADYEDDREAILAAMLNAQDSLTRYQDALNGEGSLSIEKCVDLMEGDYITLTSKMQAAYWE